MQQIIILIYTIYCVGFALRCNSFVTILIKNCFNSIIRNLFIIKYKRCGKLKNAFNTLYYISVLFTSLQVYALIWTHWWPILTYTICKRKVEDKNIY